MLCANVCRCSVLYWYVVLCSNVFYCDVSKYVALLCVILSCILNVVLCSNALCCFVLAIFREAKEKINSQRKTRYSWKLPRRVLMILCRNAEHFLLPRFLHIFGTWVLEINSEKTCSGCVHEVLYFAVFPQYNKSESAILFCV